MHQSGDYRREIDPYLHLPNKASPEIFAQNFNQGRCDTIEEIPNELMPSRNGSPPLNYRQHNMSSPNLYGDTRFTSMQDMITSTDVDPNFRLTENSPFVSPNPGFYQHKGISIDQSPSPDELENKDPFSVKAMLNAKRESKGWSPRTYEKFDIQENRDTPALTNMQGDPRQLASPKRKEVPRVRNVGLNDSDPCKYQPQNFLKK
jgi:hypothetical protein